MKNLKFLLFVFLFTSAKMLSAQSAFVITDVSKALADIKKNGQKSTYIQSLDFEAFLYLDKASFKILQKTYPDFKITQNIDTALMYAPTRDKENIKTFPYASSNVKNIFSKEKDLQMLKQYLAAMSSEANPKHLNINKEIYIKGESAILTLSGDNAYSMRYKLVVSGDKLLLCKLLYNTVILHQ